MKNISNAKNVPKIQFVEWWSQNGFDDDGDFPFVIINLPAPTAPSSSFVDWAAQRQTDRKLPLNRRPITGLFGIPFPPQDGIHLLISRQFLLCSPNGPLACLMLGRIFMRLVGRWRLVFHSGCDLWCIFKHLRGPQTSIPTNSRSSLPPSPAAHLIDLRSCTSPTVHPHLLYVNIHATMCSLNVIARTKVRPRTGREPRSEGARRSS